MNKAVYAGSFDPLTNGHVDIIRRAAKMCDKLVVGVIANPQKQPLFEAEERIRMIKKSLPDMPNVDVEEFTGLLADFVNDNDFNMVVRGLRGVSDFESEIQMAQMNARLYEEKVETVFLMSDPAYSFFSSSMAKEVASLGGDISQLVPHAVEKALRTKFGGTR